MPVPYVPFLLATLISGGVLAFTAIYDKKTGKVKTKEKVEQDIRQWNKHKKELEEETQKYVLSTTIPNYLNMNDKKPGNYNLNGLEGIAQGGSLNISTKIFGLREAILDPGMVVLEAKKNLMEKGEERGAEKILDFKILSIKKIPNWGPTLYGAIVGGTALVPK